MTTNHAYHDKVAEDVKILYGVDLAKPGRDALVDDAVMLGERFNRQPSAVAISLALHFKWKLVNCPECSGAGWVALVYSAPGYTHHECLTCHNPAKLPCP